MSSRDTRPMLVWPWHLSAVSPARHRDIFCLFFAVLLGACIALPACQSASDAPAPPPDTPLAWDDKTRKARRGALVDEVVFTQESDLGKVAGMIEKGTYHLFAQGITHTTVFHRLRDSRTATFEMAYGSSSELTLNPAGPVFKNGQLNPFAVPEIREALNWLIDRRHISEELYGGLAVPKYLPLNTAFPDYAALAEVVRRLELAYSPDPARAQRIIARHMRQLGAVQKGGVWHYNERPVTLHLLIRSDDTRKQIGDYVGNLLEDIGFRTSRLYRTAEEGARIWFGGDPLLGQWHLYTGGWVSTIINRDQSQNFSFYYTKRGRSAPLWQAYNPTPAFDNLCERLERSDFATAPERADLMSQALEHAMRDSVRVWLIDQLNIFPRAENLGVSADLAGGIPGSRLWPYTLHFRDRVGGRVIYATPGMLVEPWNPVAGSNWLFDSTIYRALNDSPVLPDPFTGLFHPQRIQKAILTAESTLPVTRTLDWISLETQPQIDVPPDAWLGWLGRENRFAAVSETHPEGLTARTRTRIIYDAQFLSRTWHDGTPMSMADIMLPWILAFCRADEASPLYDASYLPGFEVFMRHFKGLQIIDTAPLTIDFYSDQAFLDAETIVAQRALEPLPWHMLAIGIRAETAGELAFSSHKADQLRTDWMNYIAGPSLAVLRRHLEAAARDNWVPFAAALAPWLAAPDEPAQRYKALQAWHAARQHLWVGDGPFYLHAVHPVERIVTIRRFADFPDPADKWLRFSRPEIPEAEVDGPMLAPMSQSARFSLRVTYRGAPYPQDALEPVQYLLFDGDGKLAHRGDATFVAPGQYAVILSPDVLRPLGTGANSLELVVRSRRVVLPTFVSHAFATVEQMPRSVTVP